MGRILINTSWVPEIKRLEQGGGLNRAKRNSKLPYPVFSGVIDFLPLLSFAGRGE
jgi:hypothetical protein